MKEVKKTMIFNQDHLDIINGLARIKRIEIKNTLFQLLRYSINNLDEETREEALRLGKYIREGKKKIYFIGDNFKNNIMLDDINEN